MTVSRTMLIKYGNWFSNTAGYHVTGVHEFRDVPLGDFAVVFDLVILSSSATDLASDVDTFEAALRETNQRVQVSYSSQIVLNKDPGLVIYTAQFTRASFELLPTYRSSRSRAYRVTLSGTNVHDADGENNKNGKRSQEFKVTSSPEGLRVMDVAIEFLPSQSVSKQNAEAVAESAGLGWAKQASDYQTAAFSGVKWEIISGPVKIRDEDDRSVTVQVTYQEVGYAQSSDATNDATLVGTQYACFATEESAQVFTGVTSASIGFLRVVFSSGVIRSESTDLNDVIKSKVLPYIRSVVKSAITVPGALIEDRRDLRADPVKNRISGSVDFLAPATGGALAATKAYRDQFTDGREFLEVLSDEDYAVDEHLRSPTLFREVAFTYTEVGIFGASVNGYVPAALAALLDAEVDEQEAEGFLPIGGARSAAEVVQQLEISGLSRVISGAIRTFRRVNVQRSSSNALQSIEQVGPNG